MLAYKNLQNWWIGGFLWGFDVGIHIPAPWFHGSHMGIQQKQVQQCHLRVSPHDTSTLGEFHICRLIWKHAFFDHPGSTRSELTTKYGNDAGLMKCYEKTIGRFWVDLCCRESIGLLLG